MMEKAISLREDSKWAALDRNILAIIFDRLDIMDITMGASRVCIYWFLVSLSSRTHWNTIDLTKFKYKGKHVLYKYRVDDEVEETLSCSNLLIKINKFFSSNKVEGVKLRNLLIEITKLSRTSPRNLFFNFRSYIQNKDLMFVAERMPNIEKLALPVLRSLSNSKVDSSLRFAFSQWKNLNTLIIAYNAFLIWCKFDYRAVGENCSNLNNLKIMGSLDNYDLVEIVRYLQSLKRLSLKYSVVHIEGVISLLRGLENLTILNLTHCQCLGYYSNTANDFAQAVTEKQFVKIIICTEDDCNVCKNLPGMFGFHAVFEKQWRKDEIKELEF